MNPYPPSSVETPLQRESENEKALLAPLLPASPPIEEVPPRPRCFGLRRRRRYIGTHREPRSQGRKICMRLLHFVVILSLVVLYLRPTIHRFIRGILHHHSMEYPQNGDECVERAVWTPTDDTGSPHRPRFQHFASTSFQLPRFSDLLYFVSGGSYANGVISITNSPGVPTDTVEVEIVASYNSQELFDGVDVCTLHRGGDENKNGVGIFTPHYWPQPHDHRMHFYVNVKLPLPDGGPEGDYLFFNDLETRLPLFVHHVGDLQNTALFHLLDLSSSNTPIDVESVLAEKVLIKATNNNIKGTFNVTDNIDLITTNGAIRVNVNLDSDAVSETSASLRSTNGPVVGDFSLRSTTQDGSKGIFRVSTFSTNAPVDAKFPVAPIGHTLHLIAHTSNSPVSASLHKSFEGSFTVSSSPFIPPSIQYDRDIPDPAGRGRHRRVEYSRQRRGEITGSTSWSAPGERHDVGDVELSTSNSPAHLIL